ncbi:MAG: hypothetical protein M5U13_00915 [Thermoanaerobaculia bacterium]|nr:hypothetical protein [Thermoanaerobaculia bacterium]
MPGALHTRDENQQEPREEQAAHDDESGMAAEKLPELHRLGAPGAMTPDTVDNERNYTGNAPKNEKR